MGSDNKDNIHEVVRKRYGDIARKGGCCSGNVSSCCGNNRSPLIDISQNLGYSREELKNLPEGANLGLGCGNPLAIASIKPGETILDLGSGAGIDCFLASRKVGKSGKVIGVDMTSDMLSQARHNAAVGKFNNVEFRLGEIENLPMADNQVDLVISNCVINLSPDKPRVYSEIYRVLKPGGRVSISDIVAAAELPEDVKSDLEAHAGCIAGALRIDLLRKILKDSGFEQIEVALKEESRAFIRDWMPGKGLENYIVSALIQAAKPSV